MSETKRTVKRAKTVVPKFDKADLLMASAFTKLEVDILKVVLEEDKQYSLEQAKSEINKFKEAI
ncbi:hypothetical protein [Lactiplantibacillus paraplantarum]|uniref:Uncharacterized protein n=1 Tax=Lactiplantibacillus paraplantarum TaxID=60520 RepID=A0AAD0TS83_9LACO|nr:hypothetical protein [Lactiplantibacillus paraplantarum]AYJ38876.1 hypothetical protein LP667_08625 [Lactiplantibacillus paraplantarum]AYJ38930.1 hypothetical protein LP667_08920 [Lactiplantibacillus paraplantarum]KRL51356.1 hypothetical protein FD48_GL000036 [Lactiplantibacillus paraplantarum DSM 10667]MCU4683968.1 hypothetical protein [Lactiplantibacillus paraplantarum]MDL2061096.1 hypothetical protein [Lactiplantibacillus paraplantarum]